MLQVVQQICWMGPRPAGSRMPGWRLVPCCGQQQHHSQQPELERQRHVALHTRHDGWRLCSTFTECESCISRDAKRPIVQYIFSMCNSTLAYLASYTIYRCGQLPLWHVCRWLPECSRIMLSHNINSCGPLLCSLSAYFECYRREQDPVVYGNVYVIYISGYGIWAPAHVGSGPGNVPLFPCLPSVQLASTLYHKQFTDTCKSSRCDVVHCQHVLTVHCKILMYRTTCQPR